MAIETKDIFGYLGLDESQITDIEKFKQVFNDEEKGFVPAKDHKAKIGRSMGEFETKIRSAAKTYIPNFDPKVFEGKQLDEKLQFVFEAQAQSNQSMVSDLTGKVQELESSVNKKKDEVVKEWESKYSQLEKKLKDTEKLHSDTISEYTGFKSQAEQMVKGVKLDVRKKEAFGNLKLKQNISDLEKAGFNTIIESKYKFELDEQDQLYPVDAKTGERLKSSKQIGAFKSVDEVLMEEAIAQKVYAVQDNKRGSVIPGRVVPQQQNQQRQITSPTGRQAFQRTSVAAAQRAAGNQ